MNSPILYGHGVTVLAVIVLFVATAAAGPWLLPRFSSLASRDRHKELLAASSGIAGVINAVLLAFIVFAAWTNYDRARDATSRESALVNDIVRDLDAAVTVRGTHLDSLQSDSVHNEVVAHLEAYLRFVTDSEWPAMQGALARGRDGQFPSFRAGYAALRHAYDDLVAVEPHGEVQKMLLKEELTRFNDLFDARRERVSYRTEASLSPVVWGVVLAGGLLTVICCGLFAFDDKALHFATTMIVAACFGLVFYLIMALDTPFAGRWGIKGGPFQVMLTRIVRSEAAEDSTKQAQAAAARTPITPRR